MKLLKKTKEFGEQATRLEHEFDKLKVMDVDLQTIDCLNLDSKNKQMETIDKGGIQIPKLDFTDIYL